MKSVFTSLETARRRWLILAFMAGTINAGGFLACGRFVTHVTGFATFFGIDMAAGELLAALGMLIVPFFYLLGAFASGFAIDVRIRKDLPPRYDIVLITIFLCLIASALLGHFQFFGKFGREIEVGPDFILVSILCFASGMQNALITTSTGAVIRTTHLTGITTDLGIDLARLMADKSMSQERSHQLANNRVRFGIIIAFTLGSSLGTVLFLRFKYLGFLLPAAIALYATQLVFRHKRLTKLVYVGPKPESPGKA